MTRASEFCYIAETRDGQMLMAIGPFVNNLIVNRGGGRHGYPAHWTKNPELALRITETGKAEIVSHLAMSAPIGFRKVLAG